MDKELLTTLGLDPEKDLKGLLEDLEGKQYEFFERLETTNDEKRKEELNGLLTRIDKTISLIKDQMASLDSGIILDTGDAKAEAEAAAAAAAAEKQKKKEEKEKEKAKAAELAAKVQALKEKEEARRQQEAQAAEAAKQAAAQQAAEAAKQAAAQPSAQQPAPAPAPAPQPRSDLQQGLLHYQKSNFTAAFPIFKQLAERNDATAQYMLACMYNRGEGTAVDHERAEFWMKKSADNGDKVAQFDYAIFLLADHNRDNAKTATGIQYLKRSADQGHRDAMERYIELVEKGTGGLHELRTARSYCAKLMPLMEDSYDKQKFEQCRRALRARQKKIQRRRFGGAASSFVATTGALILMVPTVLMFAGYHQEFLLTLPQIQQLPQMLQAILFSYWYPGSLTVTIAGVEDVLAFLALPVQHSLMLIGAGWALKGASYKYSRNGFSTAIVRIGCALRYIAIGGHIALCAFLETDMTANAFVNMGAVLVVIVAGRIVGWILGKILGTKAA